MFKSINCEIPAECLINQTQTPPPRTKGLTIKIRVINNWFVQSAALYSEVHRKKVIQGNGLNESEWN